MTASQSGKTSIGGTASSAKRARTVSTIAEVKSNATLSFRRAVRADVASRVGQELAVVTKTAN